ncbi:MAG: hypothetical protein ACKO0Z_09120 [Betaproteobacteria bacterium]
MTYFQTIPTSGSAEVPMNENFESAEFVSVYSKRHPATSGLTWGYWGGRWGGFAISNGTLSLTASSTNYIVVQKSDGAISISTASTNWDNTSAYARVYKVTTNTTAVTAVEDHRAGANGIFGGGGASLTDPLLFKGVIDCSANPNYPAADAGDVYKVSVAGKIGGASGPSVEVGDTLLCTVDGSSSGTHGSVGANWAILQTNIQTQPYVIATYWPGILLNSVILNHHEFVVAADFPANMTGSSWKAEVSATAQTDITVQKNGSNIGTIRFAAAGTTATFVGFSAASFAIGDHIKFVAPASADATLANIRGSLLGTR